MKIIDSVDCFSLNYQCCVALWWFWYRMVLIVIDSNNTALRQTYKIFSYLLPAAQTSLFYMIKTKKYTFQL